MPHLIRNEKAVSPVIAIILMVAITVVLAGTLWLMVVDTGDDVERDMYGNIEVDINENYNGDGKIESWDITLETTSIPEIELYKVDARLIYEDDGGNRNEITFHEKFDDFHEEASWEGLADGNVQANSLWTGTLELDDYDPNDQDSQGGFERVQLTVEDYDGFIRQDL